MIKLRLSQPPSALGVEDLAFKVDGSVSLTLGGANITSKALVRYRSWCRRNQGYAYDRQ